MVPKFVPMKLVMPVAETVVAADSVSFVGPIAIVPLFVRPPPRVAYPAATAQLHGKQ